MTEERPESSGESTDTRPSSLVERAAKRIIVDQGRMPGERSGAAAAPSSRSGVVQAIDRSGTHDTPIEDGHSEGLATAGPQTGEPAQAGNGKHGRRSRIVKIDPVLLASRNLLTPQSKRSREVEEFRLIKRRVLSRRWTEGEGYGNTIMITSALPEEGKTTISINLAMSIAAEEDLRVLLVDADFIKPDALRRLGISEDKGLIDVIQDPRMDISDVMLRTDIEKLSLIPSGRLHDRCTELLASARMNEIIAELSNRYQDRILIFDSPPVLATTESVTLASHMGQIVFVVQAERTRRQLVDSALELLGNRENVGLVLNRAKPRIGSAEFGYYYNSYYSAPDEKESR